MNFKIGNAIFMKILEITLTRKATKITLITSRKMLPKNTKMIQRFEISWPLGVILNFSYQKKKALKTNANFFDIFSTILKGFPIVNFKFLYLKWFQNYPRFFNLRKISNDQ